jgi:DNA-binding MarR family transcriptional regulator
MIFRHYKINIIPKLFFSYVNGRLKDTEVTGMHCPYFLALGEHPGVTMAELSRHVHLDKSNTSRILKELEGNAFIRIEEDTSDGRIKRIYMTDKGQQYYQMIDNIMKEWNKALFKDITEEEKKIIDAIVDKIILNARDASKSYRDEAEDNNA